MMRIKTDLSVLARWTFVYTNVPGQSCKESGLASELGRLETFKRSKSETLKVKIHSSPNAKGSRCSKFVKGRTSFDFSLIISGIDTLDKLSATC